MIMDHFKRKPKNPMTRGEAIFGWIYVLAEQYPLPLLLALILSAARIPMTGIAWNTLIFGLNFSVVMVVFRRYLQKNLRQFTRNLGHCISIAVIGYMIYYAANTLTSILTYVLMPHYANANNEAIQTMTEFNYPLMLLNTVILVPITEEVFYRGVIFGSLDKTNRLLAYVVSVLVFSAIHVVGYIGSDTSAFWVVISLLQYIPASICLAWTYAQTDSIFTPTLIHMAINLLAMLSMR
jgi:membrane protease YdiL (CAAX protease family)